MGGDTDKDLGPVKRQRRQIGGWLVLAALLLGTKAIGQVTALDDNLKMNLTGLASFGYNGFFSDAGNSNGMLIGGQGSLTGYYYHPKFLSFRVDPYYNQSRLNSTSNSIYGSTGIHTSADLFTGGHMPVGVSFDKTWDSQNQIDFPGAPSFISHGRGTGFSVGWGLYYENKPSVQVNYSLNDSSYDILGAQTEGDTHAKSLSVSSGYTVAGFNLAALYTNTSLNQNLPFIADTSQKVSETTHQDGIQFSASRRLWDSTNWAASIGHSHSSADYAGLNDESNTTVSSSLTLAPLPKLAMNLNVTYGTNYAAALLQGILPQGSPAAPASSSDQILSNSSDYLTYGVHANYTLTRQWYVNGGADRREQNLNATFVQTDTVYTGTGYSHSLAGGSFGVGYSISWFSSLGAQSGIGQTASASYSRPLLGWRSTANFNLNHNTSTAILNYTSDGYGGALGVSRNVGAVALSLNASASKSRVNGLGNSDSLANGFGASVGWRTLSLGGNYGRTYGNGLQLASGIVPVPPPGQVLLPSVLVYYNGRSYSVSGGWRPARRWTLNGTYIRTRYDTSGSASSVLSDNLSTDFLFRTSYYFRQMTFNAGYSRVLQGFGVNINNPAHSDSFYVGVTRAFNFF